jgi:cystathionine beta-lyase/cystathionine gamma-synthase
VDLGFSTFFNKERVVKDDMKRAYAAGCSRLQPNRHNEKKRKEKKDKKARTFTINCNSASSKDMAEQEQQQHQQQQQQPTYGQSAGRDDEAIMHQMAAVAAASPRQNVAIAVGIVAAAARAGSRSGDNDVGSSSAFPFNNQAIADAFRAVAPYAQAVLLQAAATLLQQQQQRYEQAQMQQMPMFAPRNGNENRSSSTMSGTSNSGVRGYQNESSSQEAETERDNDQEEQSSDHSVFGISTSNTNVNRVLKASAASGGNSKDEKKSSEPRNDDILVVEMSGQRLLRQDVGIARMPQPNTEDRSMQHLQGLDRLLTGHPSNQMLQRCIYELAKRYNRVKNSFQETAVDVLFRQVYKKGGRFLRKSSHGTWLPMDEVHTRAMLQKFFQRSCEQVQESLEITEDHKHGGRQEQKKRKRDMEADHRTQHEREEAHPTHMNVNLANIPQDSFFIFGKNLSMNDHLESIHIETALIPISAANVVATGLKQSKNLIQVKLQFAKFECFDRHLLVLLEGLFENPSIQSINLNNNGLDGKACAIICDLFAEKLHNRIARLSIENNSIGDDGAKALSKAMLDSSWLRYLSVGNNGFSFHGIEVLENAVQEVPRLVEVSGLYLPKCAGTWTKNPPTDTF